MVTESAKAIALMLAMSLAGCATRAVLPEKSEQPRAVDASVQAPLPKQEYDGDGQPVPYEAEPNPYTTDTADVPARARELFSGAASALADKRLNEAEAGFQKITDQWPRLSGPWVKLAEIAEKRDNNENAEFYYRKAIEVNRNNVNAYIALALLYREQGRFGDAQATYLASLDLWPDFPDAHLNLAILYDLYVNKPVLAQKHYEAYAFLSGGEDPRVEDWLTEIRRRTGIEKSFIDNPPPAHTAAEKENKTTPESGQPVDAG